MVDSTGVWVLVRKIKLHLDPPVSHFLWFEYSPIRKEYRAVLEQSGAIYSYIATDSDLVCCAYKAASALIEKYNRDFESAFEDFT